MLCNKKIDIGARICSVVQCDKHFLKHSKMVTLSPIRMKWQRWFDQDEYTMYYPNDNLILQKVQDEQDIIYRFYDILHVPELKMVLFLSGYVAIWRERSDGTYERNVTSLDNKIEKIIRDILELSEEYIVTDSRELFKQQRAAYLTSTLTPITYAITQRLNADVAEKIMNDYVALNTAKWVTADVDNAKPLKGNYFVEDYPKDGDPNKILAIGWNSPSEYVCWLMSYFEHVKRPKGIWNECNVSRETYITMVYW